ncbi:hypothetical protein VP01_3480g1 [Puccinia sorghi]|uniref:Integrase catalytic domain-containing protein n=1 Tax=Puccinia sorghi TaxID=27349 RepID=A0A0L6UVY1_9BASI|nr:hypothetical protein VP01_3480g1 [Puccinia sorghi]
MLTTRYSSGKQSSICSPPNTQPIELDVKSAIEKLHEVGINRDVDIIAYEIIKKLPKTPEYNGISTAITHSGSSITPELVLDHLRLHANQLAIEGTSSSISMQQVSLFTDPSRKCRNDTHNTLANHPASRYWKMYPHLCPPSESAKTKEGHSEHSVSSFFSSQPPMLPCFILDSGSTAHMTANANLFVTLDPSEEGIVRTSSGAEAMKIKGIGSIKLENEHGSFFLNKVLYVPELVVNLLSVRCLVLDEYLVKFEMNSFSVSKSNNLVMSGNYISNLPTLEFKNMNHSSLYSPSELLHKSLGHAVNAIAQAVGLEAKRVGYYPTIIHSDRGTEFVNSHLLEFCTKNLIRTRQSDAYTPQQNGLAERFNRTIIESTRAIFQDTGLNKCLWSEIVKTSTLTLNQILFHKSKISPYEHFKGQKIDLNFFKPVGTRASYLIQPERHNAKLGAKGLLGTLIGYNDKLLSYKLLGDNGRIIHTKHLTFLDLPSPKNSSFNDEELTFLHEDESDVSPEAVESDAEITEKPSESSHSKSYSEPCNLVKIMPGPLPPMKNLKTLKDMTFGKINMKNPNLI